MAMDSDGLVLPREMERVTYLLLKAFPQLSTRYTIPHVGLALADIIRSAKDGQDPPPCPLCGVEFGRGHNAAPHLDQLRQTRGRR